MKHTTHMWMAIDNIDDGWGSPLHLSPNHRLETNYTNSQDNGNLTNMFLVLVGRGVSMAECLFARMSGGNLTCRWPNVCVSPQ